MDRTELIDKLNRAYEMEEAMVGILIDLCRPDAISTELSSDIRKEIQNTLLNIKTDSLRHKKIVSEMINGVK